MNFTPTIKICGLSTAAAQEDFYCAPARTDVLRVGSGSPMPRNQTARKTSPPPAPVRIGEIRRFGVYGILYEVTGVANADTVHIRVIETGEETTYPVAKLLLDPTD
jgi:Family of unknown function (DUF5397)